MTRAGILGLGISLPEKVLTNADLEKMVETTDEWIVSRTGIKERRVLSEGEKVSDIGAKALVAGCKDAGIELTDVDLILCCTYTGDYVAPNTACNIQHKLGLKAVACMDLNAACSGFIYGLQTADALVRGGVYKRIAVIGLEAQSRFTNYTDRNTCVLFGDGAGCVIVGAQTDGSDRGILSTFCGADGCGGTMIVLKCSGTAYPPTPEDLAEHRHQIWMNGKEVFKFAVKVLGVATDEALSRAGLTAADIDLLVPHQANIRIIEGAAQRYGMPMDRVVCNVDRYGNTSAASIPLALHDARESGQLKPGMTLALVAFGAGLTYGAAIVRW